jgi:FtsZ-interacting cell division protein ZipA
MIKFRINNDIIKKNSLPKNQTNRENQTNDNPVTLHNDDNILNIVIGVLCGICVVIIVLVFVWKKRKNKITDKNTHNITLKDRVVKAKPPHTFNKTNSSKTDETVINIPHDLNNINTHNNSKKQNQNTQHKPHQKPNLKKNINETKVNSVHKKHSNKNHVLLNNSQPPLPTRKPQLKQKNLPTLPHQNNDLEAGNVN